MKKAVLALLLAAALLVTGCTLPWEQTAFPTPELSAMSEAVEAGIRRAAGEIAKNSTADSGDDAEHPVKVTALSAPDWSADDMEALEKAVETLAEGTDYSALWTAWEALLEFYNTYDEACILLRIQADLAPEDDALREKAEALEDEDAYEYVCDAVSAILDTGHRARFLVDTDCDGYAGLEGYSSDKTDEEETREDRITALEREYDDAYYELDSAAVLYKGEEWTQTRLNEEGGGLSYADYWAVAAALEKAQNEILAPIVVELVNLRNEGAREGGYENYYDMEWTDGYCRDYTWEEYEAIRSGVLEYLTELDSSLSGSGYPNYYYEDGYNWDVASFFSVCAASQRLPQSVREAFGAMDSADVLILAPLTAREGYYTNFLAREKLPVIYWNYTNCMYDLVGVCHEAGHGVNAVLSAKNSFEWDMFSSIDLSEVQSQSSTLLLDAEMAACQPGWGQEISHMAVADVISGLTTQCMYTDLERALYTYEGTLTVEAANAIANEAAAPWDYVANYCCASENYVWASNNFLADYPVYMASYVSSAAASLALWQRYQEDPEQALALYGTLMELDPARVGFREGMELLGLEDLFSPALYESVAASVRTAFPELG